MVVNCATTVPVVSPVAPAPTKSSEEANSKSNTERESAAAPKNPGDRIPAWIRDNRRSVHQPGIISRHVDDVRVGWLDVDRAVLIADIFLLSAFQVSRIASLLTHGLHFIGDTLRVVGVGVAEG